MAVNLEDSKFFEEKKEQFVVLRGTARADEASCMILTASKDPPKFDLDSYISNYDGMKTQAPIVVSYAKVIL